ncbi:putative Protein HypA [Paratrimastix pyriformis]|uniref:Peptidase M16C associated domain-containing protein n=1 Tax=Paratrimastix pyriformis TaxID=342808 RepID=A0ABQ8UEQ7_9EUKA|nr:putative Protein HypA [Paratrimastix pyriformis]
MQIGEVYSGFLLQEIHEVPEIESRALIFLHQKTQMPLMKLESKDDNKFFAIAFATPPPNDAGLPHILEHSVLAGSKRFPTKDPFSDAAKGSLKTFINAFTYNDKTVYPVGSQCVPDFFNLIDLYMDAVFEPQLLENKNIFLQEGWRHEIAAAGDPIALKGIVYSEMKGAYSSPEQLGDRALERLLFRDPVHPEAYHPYAVDSGGNPEHIPSLSYRMCCDFHRVYYRPSNARCIITGDGDTAAELAFLEERYLGAMGPAGAAPQPPPPHWVNTVDEETRARLCADHGFPAKPEVPLCARHEAPLEATIPVAIGSTEDPAGRGQLAMGWVLDGVTSDDVEGCLAMQILQRLLVSRTGAPLREALLHEAALGTDLTASFDSDLRQVAAPAPATNLALPCPSLPFPAPLGLARLPVHIACVPSASLAVSGPSGWVTVSGRWGWWSLGLVVAGAGGRWGWWSLGLVVAGAGGRWGWWSLGLVVAGAGGRWGWWSLGLVVAGAGGRWGWWSLGLVVAGAGGRWGWWSLGLVVAGAGGRWGWWSLGLVVAGAGGRWGWWSLGLVVAGAGGRWGWWSLGLVVAGAGGRWGWWSLGLVVAGAGGRWGWWSLGLVVAGAGGRWGWWSLGLVVAGAGGRWGWWSLGLPTFVVTLKGTGLAKKDAFWPAMRDALLAQVEKGFDPQEIESAWNMRSFAVRHLTTPTAAWRTSSTPCAPQASGPPRLASLSPPSRPRLAPRLAPSRPVSPPSFPSRPVSPRLSRPRLAPVSPPSRPVSPPSRPPERLVMKHLVANPTVLVALDPSLTETQDRAMAQQMADLKAGLSGDAVEGLVAQTAALQAHQSRDDSPAALATLPLLDPAHIPARPPIVPTRETTLPLPGAAPVPLYHCPVGTSGMYHLRLLFDAARLPAAWWRTEAGGLADPAMMEDAAEEEAQAALPGFQAALPYIGLMATLAGKLSTARCPYLQLGTQCLAAPPATTYGADYTRQEPFLLCFQAALWVLPAQLGPALDLLAEILRTMRFDETTRFLEARPRAPAPRYPCPLMPSHPATSLPPPATALPPPATALPPCHCPATPATCDHRGGTPHLPTGTGRHTRHVSPARPCAQLDGVDQYRFLRQCEAALSAPQSPAARRLVQRMGKLAEALFVSSRMRCGLTCPDPMVAGFTDAAPAHLAAFPAGPPEGRGVCAPLAAWRPQPRNEALATASKDALTDPRTGRGVQVVYNGTAADFRALTFDPERFGGPLPAWACDDQGRPMMTGRLQVCRLVADDYLRQAIRVRGGAYAAIRLLPVVIASPATRRDVGPGRLAGRDGLLHLPRADPNVEQTYQAFATLPDYLAKFAGGPVAAQGPSVAGWPVTAIDPPRDLDLHMRRFIIGTIGYLDSPLSPGARSAQSLGMHLSGLTVALKQHERDEILRTRPEDVAALAPLFRAVLAQGYRTSLGNEALLKRSMQMGASVGLAGAASPAEPIATPDGRPLFATLVELQK